MTGMPLQAMFLLLRAKHMDQTWSHATSTVNAGMANSAAAAKHAVRAASATWMTQLLQSVAASLIAQVHALRTLIVHAVNSAILTARVGLVCSAPQLLP